MKSERRASRLKDVQGCGAVLALTLLVLLLWWTAAHARAYAKEERPPVLLLGNASLPPMNFIKEGKPEGIVVDLTRAMAERMHRPVDIRLMNWTEAQRLVSEGRADGLLQINPSPERLRTYDFSDTLLTSEFTIFTSRDRLGIRYLRDLQGLKVGVEGKGLPITLVREDPRIIVEIIPDFVKGFEMLAAGVLDAVVADQWVGSYVVAENRIRGVKLIEYPVAVSDSAIAVKKGDADLLKDINAALKSMREDGTYDRIVQSWRPKEVVFKTREEVTREAWLITAVVAALIAALIGILALFMERGRRTRVETALRESEQKLRLFVEYAPAAIAMFDRDMKYVAVSRRWLADYALADRDIIGCSHYEVFPDIPERWKEIHRQCLAGGTARCDEDPFPREDGTITWVAWEIHPWLNRDGGAGGIIIFSEVITARKQAEERLRESRAHLEAALESMTDAVFISDGEGRFVEFNDAFATYHRFGTKDECYKTLAEYPDILEVFFPDGTAAPLDMWAVARALRGEKASNAEYILLRKDTGERWWGNYSFGPIRDENGKIVGSVVTGRDVTEAKRAEEALRLSEKRSRMAQAAAGAGLWEWDLATNESFWSQELWDLYGLKPYSREPSYESWIGTIHPDDRERTEEVVQRAARDGAELNGEWRVLLPDGAIRWLMSRGGAIRDAGGRIVRLIGIIMDVTARKKTEEQIRASLLEKETMLKEIHHRVKNNMQVISSLLKMQARYVRDPEDADFFKVSTERIKSMALVHDRLYRSGTLASISLPDYVRELAGELVSIYGRGMRIATRVDTTPISVGIDEAIPVGLILNELISNSLKHAFPVDGTGVIRVSMEEKGREITLTVSDTGIGFPENLDFMNTSSLGMQLVVTLVEQLEGAIELVRGKGAEFKISFEKAGG